jgi:hypothetical protein
MSDVAENSDAAAFTAKDKPDRIDRIVGDRKGLDLDSIDREPVSGFERSPDDF